MVIIKKAANKNGEDVMKLEPSYANSGHVKWCRPFGKQFGSSSDV